MTSKVLAATALAGGLAVGGAAHAQSVAGVVGGVTGGGVNVSAPGVNVNAGIGGSAGAFGAASPGLAPGGLGMAPAPSSAGPAAGGSAYAVGAAGANATAGQPGFGRPAVHGPLPLPGAFPTVRWSDTQGRVRSNADAGRAKMASEVRKVAGRTQARADARAATPARRAMTRADGAAQARLVTAKTGPAPAREGDRVTARLNRQAARGVNVAQDRTSGAAADSRALAARIRAAADESASLRTRLADLSPGMVVRDTRGQRVGVVSRVVRSGGTIRSVLVTAADGARRTALSPHSLSISGGVVTTTQFGARAGS